jgi:glycosyltransferase involved in cell wall biosynthesis
MKKLLLITDAWEPQINGVVTTLKNTIVELEKIGVNTFVLSPESCKFKMDCPTYPDIKLGFLSVSKLKKILKDESPDFIHIATEGPLGLIAKLYLQYKKIPYSTSYHTKFPEYINSRFKFISINFVYFLMRSFHNNSKCILTTTDTMKKELEAKQFKNVKVWGRGADTQIFTYNEPNNENINLLYVGRVSIEKNLNDLLDLDVRELENKYSKKVVKIIVGDGPDLPKLKKLYTENNIKFIGAKKGKELAEFYRNADVFVFPSKTDTFGIVMIEANYAGIPVAAYPVTGPIDFVENGKNGFLSDNLQEAIDKCLSIARHEVREHAILHWTWQKATEVFHNNLFQIDKSNGKH